MKNFIETFDGALSPEECKYFIDYINNADLKQAAFGSGKGASDPRIKDCWEVYETFSDDDKLLPTLRKYTIEYRKMHPQLDRNVYIWDLCSNYNFQKYEPGQGYHSLHCENDGREGLGNRVLAWMFYLNTVPDGGTYFENYDLSMDAVEGRLVIWPAYWTHVHRGITSHTQTKYIATGWHIFKPSPELVIGL